VNQLSTRITFNFIVFWLGSVKRGTDGKEEGREGEIWAGNGFWLFIPLRRLLWLTTDHWPLTGNEQRVAWTSVATVGALKSVDRPVWVLSWIVWRYTVSLFRLDPHVMHTSVRRTRGTRLARSAWLQRWKWVIFRDPWPMWPITQLTYDPHDPLPTTHGYYTYAWD